MTAVTICNDFGAQENKICHSLYFFPSICHEAMGPEKEMQKKKKKKKCKKAKWLSEEALQVAVKRREAKSKGEKERYTHLNRVAKNSKKG